MHTETIIIGTADAIEAEYGQPAIDGKAVTVVVQYEGEFEQADGFDTIQQARDAYDWGVQHSDTLHRSFVNVR
jgi:hypothetical protein